MKASRVLAAPNWRYAIGEVVLIVIGVTIALAATSWYEDRLARQDEILVLQQLRGTLTEDLQEVNMTWEMTKERERKLTALLNHLDSDGPYSPELGVNFQALFGWRIVRLTTAPFESLKLDGYATISHPVLREKLISFYEDHYAKLEYNSHVDRDFAVHRIQPYFFENFVMSIAESGDVDRGNQVWVPKDYQRLKSESYIANISRFRADILRRFLLRDYQNTTDAMQEIVDLIDQELDSTD